MNFKTLSQMSNRQLEDIMRNSKKPNMTKIAEKEYNGWNMGLLPSLSGLQKFRKGFQKQDGGYFTGYNVLMQQNHFNEAWEQKLVNDEPKIFGFYEMTPAKDRYPNALQLDYNTLKNKKFEEWLLDYIVEVEPGNPDLLLGKAHVLPMTLYYRWNTPIIPPTFFVLEKFRDVSFKESQKMKKRFYK